MGSILNHDKAAAWRGPMLSGAIKQLINTTEWGDLDYLLIDMPPGTGDAYLTVFNEIKVDNFIYLMQIFYEMQSLFLSGIYKRYGDLEGGHIVIYFARDLHLEIMRKREKDMNFDLSLSKFWENHEEIRYKNLNIRVPINAKKYLKKLYGKSWKIEKNFWNSRNS